MTSLTFRAPLFLTEPRAVRFWAGLRDTIAATVSATAFAAVTWGLIAGMALAG